MVQSNESESSSQSHADIWQQADSLMIKRLYPGQYKKKTIVRDGQREDVVIKVDINGNDFTRYEISNAVYYGSDGI